MGLKTQEFEKLKLEFLVSFMSLKIRTLQKTYFIGMEANGIDVKCETFVTVPITILTSENYEVASDALFCNFQI